MHTCIHTCIHTHTHIYIYICINIRSLLDKVRGRCVCGQACRSRAIQVNIYMRIHIYLSVSRYLFLYISLAISLFLHLSIYLFVHLPVSRYLSIHPSFYISIYLSIYLSFYLYIYLHIDGASHRPAARGQRAGDTHLPGMGNCLLACVTGMRVLCYLTYWVHNVVLQKSIPAQIRQLTFYMSYNHGMLHGFVRELNLTKRL